MDPGGERVAGRYVLDRRLGAGRGGSVFAARDSRTGNRVALKILDARPENELDIERAGLRSIEHPHLVRVLDAGDDRGRAFVVSELLDGGALSEIPKPLPPATLASLANQMLEALAYLHAQGILHGDVKTENILIASLDPPAFKLSDFGLAQRSISVEAATTRGSPAFMPPEIIRGEPADERGDLYSLGVTLYECAFGELPFEDRDVRTVLMRHLTEEPSRLRSPGELDPQMWRLLRRLLAKEPAERPADARAALALWRGDEAAVPRWIPPRLGVLIGRDAELAELERALESETAVVTIEGPPGVGKTRLLREFALRTELRGTPTLWWTPSGVTASGEFYDQSLETDPTSALPEANAQGLAERRAAMLRERLGDGRFAVFIDEAEDRPAWFLQSASILMRECAARPRAGQLVCAAGTEGAAALAHESLDAGGFPSQTTLQLHPWSREAIESAASALLGARRLQPELLALLAEASGGIPAEVEAVCQVLSERGLLRLDTTGALAAPVDVSVAALAAPIDVRTRSYLGQCNPQQLLALQVLALLRVPATRTFLQWIVPLQAGDVATLRRLGLVAVLPGSQRLHLTHERLRRTLLTELPANDVRRLHDRIATTLEEHPEALPLEDPLIHRAMGSRLAAARDALRALTTRQPARADADSLALAIESALQLWPPSTDPEERTAIELEHLGALLRMGEYDRVHQQVQELRALPRFQSRSEALLALSAEGHLERGESSSALRVLDELEPKQRTSRSQFLRARALSMQGQHEETLRMCEELRHDLDEDLPARAAVVELQATGLRAVGRVAEAEHLLRAFLDAHETRMQPRATGSMLANLGLMHFYQGRMSEAERCFEQSLDLLTRAGDRYGMVRALNSLASTAGETGRLSESAERLRRALDLSRRLGETETTSYILGNLAQLLMLRAEYGEGLERAREACSLSSRRNLRTMHIQSCIVLGGILAALGQEEQCHAALQEILAEIGDRPTEGHILLLWSGLALDTGKLENVLPWLHRARTVLEAVSAEDEIVVHDHLLSRWCHATGDFAQALSLARSAVERASRLQLLTPTLELHTWIAELILPDDVHEARRLAGLSAEAARRAGLRELLWRAERVLGRVELAQDDFSAALQHYDSALRVLREIATNLPSDLAESYVWSPVRVRFFEELREIGDLER